MVKKKHTVKKAISEALEAERQDRGKDGKRPHRFWRRVIKVRFK